jgi:hypothetical protein
LEFVGKNKVGEIVKGAKSESEAVRLLKQGGLASSEKVLRPLLVDWNNGRAGRLSLSEVPLSWALMGALPQFSEQTRKLSRILWRLFRNNLGLRDEEGLYY